MAHILLVDPSEMARRAMQGILARGGHKFAAVDSLADAWSFIRRNPGLDLVFTELKLTGGKGLSLVQRLKTDCILQQLPVVIYTEHSERTAVKWAIDVHVQNFLIKPYHDESIFAEIEKIEADPWRNRLFEEEKSFCKLMGYTPAEVHRLLEALQRALGEMRAPLQTWAAVENGQKITALLTPMLEQAEAAGAWGVVDCLKQLAEHVTANAWSTFGGDLESLDFATELVAIRLDPQRVSPGFCTEAELQSSAEATELAAWTNAPAKGRCPLLSWAQLQREIDALPGCPVIDTAAAAFEMTANGHPSCINPLMDQVARDPGLSVQMLIAANAAHPPDANDPNRIEDARIAVGLLGEIRLTDQARKLVRVEERIMDQRPSFNWSQYWTYQRGVARIAQLICRDLEFHSLESVARTAGQLHDIGKLILAHLHPAGFQAILHHARLHRQSLAEVEMLYLGCTTAQMGAYFADRFGLSTRFANVLRWIDEPAAATSDATLVAIISLARDLCRQNHVGTSGDPAPAHARSLEDTPEWHILRKSLYPSFNLHAFELQVHAYCGQLFSELSGHHPGVGPP